MKPPPPKFLIGQLGDGGERWACIDPNAYQHAGAVAERRFSAYLEPYPDEGAARAALIAAGALTIDPEPGRRRRG
jgi:hypothetical protein